MAYYFGGNMQAMWDRSSSLIVGTTLAGTFDAAVVGSSVLLPASTSVTMPLVSGGPSITSKIYGHFEYHQNFGTNYPLNGNIFLAIRNLSGFPVFRIFLANPTAFANVAQCQFWNGSVYVDVGPNYGSLFSTINGLNIFDFDFTPGASGSFNLRVNNSAAPLISVSGFNAAVDNIASVQVGNWFSTANPAYISQGILADFDLRGAKYVGQRPTGNGFHTDGTGGFADVDDIVTTDTTGIGLPVVGNQKSFLHDNLVTSGMVIDAVFINSATAVSGGTVNNLRGIVRRAGSTSATANVSPSPELGIEQRSVIAEVDPTTALAWTVANFNASEIGVEARG